MSENRRDGTPLIRSLFLIAVVIAAMFVVLVGHSSGAVITIVTNDYIGELTVFEQNYSVEGITSNIFAADPLIATHIANYTLSYDTAKYAIDWHVWAGNTYRLFIGKLYPAIHTTYTVTLGMETDNFNAATYLYIGQQWIVLKYNDSALTEYCIRAYYYNASGGINIVSGVLNVPQSKFITLQITWNGENKTTHITTLDNSSINLWAPATYYDVQELPYPALSWPFAYIQTSVSYATYVDTYLKYLKQEIPRYTITAVPRNNIMPFGFDGPHDYFTYTKKGMEYLNQSGFNATLFFDNGSAYKWYTNKTYQQIYRNYVDNLSWEVGIHFNEALTTLSWANATKAIDTEVGYVKAVFGRYPTTWCSLRNSDNLTHAVYIYPRYRAYWRNSHNMLDALPNIGGIQNETWDFWQIAMEHGFVYPAFIHHTDLKVNDAWGLSYANFTKFVDTMKNNSVIFTTYVNYIKTNMNQIDFYATNIEQTDTLIKFTAHTNGARAYIDVDFPHNANVKVIDLTTNKEVKWQPGSVAFWVENGHTYLVEEVSSVAGFLSSLSSLSVQDYSIIAGVALAIIIAAVLYKPHKRRHR